MVEINLLTPVDGLEYKKLTLSKYRGCLFNCNSENVIAVGASNSQGEPVGLALSYGAAPNEQKDKTIEEWFLCSIFVKDGYRRQGIGRMLWESLSKELMLRGAGELSFQAVLRESPEKELSSFLTNMGFEKPDRVAKIFSYTCDKIMDSPFVRASLDDTFSKDERFRFVSPKELSGEALAEMRENKGDWYPEFVSPFIGWDSFNEDCTVFAIDSQNEKVAAWITAMDVNQDSYILYRTFFTREEYRDTPIGFHIFSEAVRKHLTLYPDRKVLSSVPVDNERSMRFNELFFRGTYDHISYEIVTRYIF
ncbi:MAG: GNAT family N-acetyltransferase [Bacillota bacterium]